MKSSEALRAARKLIKNGTYWYVCLAIKDVHGERTNVYMKLRKLFNTLDRRGTLGRASIAGWVEKELGRELSFEECRAYRLAWIDWMIEGYERAGD